MQQETHLGNLKESKSKKGMHFLFSSHNPLQRPLLNQGIINIGIKKNILIFEGRADKDSGMK